MARPALDRRDTEEAPRELAPVPAKQVKDRGELHPWRRCLFVLALAAGPVWLMRGCIWPSTLGRDNSPGPLASVHSTWDARCQTCHEPGHPVTGETGNQRCQGCHAGPAHHPTRSGSEPACAACHRDHRGNNASLVRLPDGVCIACHQQIQDHAPSGAQTGKVTGFLGNQHPEFKLFAAGKPMDPGRLTFSHKRHLTPGMVLTPDARTAWTYGEIQDENDRRRYGWDEEQPGRQKGDRVVLACASCHVLDARDFQPPDGTLLPSRSAGDLMLPITYESQCKACHPLTGFDPQAPGLTLPHRLQPTAVTEYLRRAYGDRLLAGRLDLLDRPVPRRPRPDRPIAEEETTVRKEIEGRIGRAEQSLYAQGQGCGKCHSFNRVGGEVTPRAVDPPEVPTVWLESARFNHTAHRAVSCRQCHARAEANDPQASVAGEDVLIAAGELRSDGTRFAGLRLCQECHAPPTTVGGTARGGVRFGCTDCHSYHNGAEPFQGPGARSRAPVDDRKNKIDIHRFLSGQADRP